MCKYSYASVYQRHFNISFALVCAIIGSVLGYPHFRSRIPNGENIPHPCDSSKLWPGVGHWNSQGGGERNTFGQAFDNNGEVRVLILNWWKGKPSGSIACTRKQQPRFYWSCSSVVMNNATPLTPHKPCDWTQMNCEVNKTSTCNTFWNKSMHVRHVTLCKFILFRYFSIFQWKIAPLFAIVVQFSFHKPYPLYFKL